MAQRRFPKAADPTADQLRRALAQLQQRPGCPTTVHAALAHPTWRICLRGLARTLPVGLQVVPTPHPPAAPAAAQRKVWVLPTPNPKTIDRKRAAANDLDD